LIKSVIENSADITAAAAALITMRRQAALRATALDAKQPNGGLELRESEGTVTGNALVKDINPYRGLDEAVSNAAPPALVRVRRETARERGAYRPLACVTAAVRASVGEVLSQLKAGTLAIPAESARSMRTTRAAGFDEWSS
jgi:hypothetical protein